MQNRLSELGREPYTRRLVSTVRGQVPENLPLKSGKALDTEPTHIIFPAEITYVDLGNENLVAGLADGAKNVLRVKSAFKSFKQETNLSVITEDGSYYTFSAPIIGA